MTRTTSWISFCTVSIFLFKLSKYSNYIGNFEVIEIVLEIYDHRSSATRLQQSLQYNLPVRKDTEVVYKGKPFA
jgi:hypothetical protein